MLQNWLEKLLNLRIHVGRIQGFINGLWLLIRAAVICQVWFLCDRLSGDHGNPFMCRLRSDLDVDIVDFNGDFGRRRRRLGLLRQFSHVWISLVDGAYIASSCELRLLGQFLRQFFHEEFLTIFLGRPLTRLYRWFQRVLLLILVFLLAYRLGNRIPAEVVYILALPYVCILL